MLVLNTILVVEVLGTLVVKEVPKDPDSENAFPKGFFHQTRYIISRLAYSRTSTLVLPHLENFSPTASQIKEKMTKAI